MNENINNQNQNIQTSFWNFKEKKVYTKSSEKLIDFLVGIFGPYVISFIVCFIFDFLVNSIRDFLNYPDFYTEWIAALLFFCIPIFYVILPIYLFNRRRFIFYGISIHFFIIVLFIIYVGTHLSELLGASI